MANDVEVEFKLYGGLRAYRNGQEVSLPEAKAGTLLRLLLLSGEPFLNNGEGRYMGSSDSIRAVVDRSNRPKRIGQSSHYDFIRQTGLELRFREPAGICLIGEGWISDIVEFEDIWRRRSFANVDELLHALSLSDLGINLETWPKEIVLKDCFEWARARIQELGEHRIQISQELSNRPEPETTSDSTVSVAVPVAPTEEEKQEEKESTHADTSGLNSDQNEPDSKCQTSTSIRDALCDSTSANIGSYVEQEPRFGLLAPWLLIWLYKDNNQYADKLKQRSILGSYSVANTDEKLMVLERATKYAVTMFACDLTRANNVFNDSLLARFLKRPLSRRQGYIHPAQYLVNLAIDDSSHKAGRKGYSWNATLLREQIRRESQESDVSAGQSGLQKRFLRACVLRSCSSIELRAAELRIGFDRSKAGMKDIYYPPAYEGELDRMYLFIMGLVHLQHLNIVDKQKLATRKGGIDPRSLRLRPGESLEARRLRASIQSWEVNVLVDAIAVPDWSGPLAKSLKDQHHQLVKRWVDEKAQIAHDKALTEQLRRQKQEEYESLPADRPLSYRESPRQQFLLKSKSVLSAWLTVFGFGLCFGLPFMTTMPVYERTLTMPAVGLFAYSVVFGAWPIWIPISIGFYRVYSRAAMDGKIQSAISFWTVMMLISLGLIVYVALTRF